MARKKNPERKKRTCLKCNHEFVSKHRFNRICPNCMKSNQKINAQEVGYG